VRAYACQADGDICYGNGDCCGNLCSANDGTPGRCLASSGGAAGSCTQDGNPCAGPSNCCTRLCLDPGSGATICQPAGGCRMTGDSCTSTSECCNINDHAPPSQQIACGNLVGGVGRCDNGGSCNPPGNICGASTDVNASQNCCDGKKDVCKADTAGIWRCFGGCPDNVCPAGCPTGYTGEAPCCIPTGTTPDTICQFKEQCCDGSLCLPDAGGVLHCTAASCVPPGASCDPSAGAAACCSGATCTPQEGGPSVCIPSGTLCLPNGGACTGAADCCSGFCIGGACTPEQTCQPPSGSCTATSDCCSGLACVVPPGQVTGTCEPAGCVGAGQQCVAGDNPCCAGLYCNQVGSGLPCDDTTPCACTLPQ
jgi:hypothetical protein